MKVNSTAQKLAKKNVSENKAELEDQLLCKLRVKPQEKEKVFLGGFDNLRGFIVELSPKTVCTDSIITRISKLETERNSKFFLDITNNSTRGVVARVRQL